MLIKEYIQKKREAGLTGEDIASILEVSPAMVSTYKKGFYPSLTTALIVYKKEGIVLHPFAEDALKFELKETNE